MKRKGSITLLAALSVLSVWAQGETGKPHSEFTQYREVKIVREDSLVKISFELTTDKKSIRRNEKLMLTPVLYNDSLHVPLPAVAVLSRRTEWQDFRAGICLDSPDVAVYRMGNNDKVQYRTQLPDTSNLKNVFLRLDRTLVSCCNEKHLPAVQLTRHAALVPVPVLPFVPQPQPLEHYLFSLPVTSVADSLSRHYPFVVSMSDFAASKQSPSTELFNPNMSLNMMEKSSSEWQQDTVERFIAENEKGAMQINFERGSTQIHRYYKTNNASLVALASVLRAIQSSDNSHVEKIVIAGFASPEGPLERNDRLAIERAAAMCQFIRANSTVTPSKVQTYNGSEDWRGLYQMILESDIKHKEKLLDIIDRVPIRAGREGQLMKVGGGEAYRYMSEHFFPQLRNAAYIKVYYDTSEAVATTSQHIRQAWVLMQGGKYADALALLKGHTSLPGGGVENLMGVCCIMQHNYERARECLLQAIAKGNAQAGENLNSINPK